jgi:hypothetical protein
MKGQEKNYLFTRSETPSHRSEIPDRRRRDERQYYDLVSSVFEQQRAAYHPPSTSDDKRTQLARKFYAELYKEPELLFGGPRGATADTTEFIDEVVLAPGEVGRNNMAFLLGNIGVGKTAYLNWLISTRFKNLVDSKKLWFVRIDLEQLKQGRLVSTGELLYWFLYRTAEIASENIHLLDDFASQLAKLQTAMAQPGDHDALIKTRAEALTELVRAVQDQAGRRLLLVLDNIDYLCHFNDRGLYYDMEDTGERHILQSICDFVEMFNRQRELGHLGANVLIVTRADSYDVLTSAFVASYPQPCSVRGAKVYMVKPVAADTAIDIRCKLMTTISADVPPGKQKHFSQIPELIQRDCECGQPHLVSHLRNLASDGLRQIMQFFAQYGWVGRESDGPRFIHSYPVGLLTFILNHRARFQQFDAKFPNIYFINRIPIAGEPYSTAHEHRHTYWLKRLLLQLVSTRRFNDAADILEVFCGNEGYDASLVRECLGSLTEAPASHCVHVERRPHPHKKDILLIRSITLTQRGYHSLRAVFDRFFYLQLIVDEALLPLPRVLAGEFSFDRQDKVGLDYSYVVSENEYQEKANQMIAVKARQVLFFLDVLRHSLALERELFPGPFRRLAERDVRIPCVENIQRSVTNELAALNPRMRRILNVTELEEAVARKSNEVRAQLEAAYLAEAH